MGMELEAFNEGSGMGKGKKKVANLPVVLFKAVLVQRVL